MRIYIENDGDIDTLSITMTEKLYGEPFTQYFDFIITNASSPQNRRRLIMLIGEADEIYTQSTFDKEGEGAQMLSTFLQLAKYLGWKDKKIINFRPRHQMNYTDEQAWQMGELRSQNIVFSYQGT